MGLACLATTHHSRGCPSTLLLLSRTRHIHTHTMHQNVHMPIFTGKPCLNMARRQTPLIQACACSKRRTQSTPTRKYTTRTKCIRTCTHSLRTHLPKGSDCAWRVGQRSDVQEQRASGVKQQLRVAAGTHDRATAAVASVANGGAAGARVPTASCCAAESRAAAATKCGAAGAWCGVCCFGAGA